MEHLEQVVSRTDPHLVISLLFEDFTQRQKILSVLHLIFILSFARGIISNRQYIQRYP